jgi:hypothetical protein
MTFEQLDRSIDADSDSDDEIAEQAHAYRSTIPLSSDRSSHSDISKQPSPRKAKKPTSPNPSPVYKSTAKLRAQKHVLHRLQDQHRRRRWMMMKMISSRRMRMIRLRTVMRLIRQRLRGMNRLGKLISDDLEASANSDWFCRKEF